MSPKDALLTAIGMSLLAPRQRGQSRGGHIMSAMGQGLATYNSAQAAEQQRLQEARKAALAERAMAANIGQSMAATEASQERTRTEREERPLAMEIKRGQIAGQKTDAEYKKALMKSQELNQQIDELKIQETQAADPVEQGKLKLQRAKLELQDARLGLSLKAQHIAESKQRMAEGKPEKQTATAKTLGEIKAQVDILYPTMSEQGKTDIANATMAQNIRNMQTKQEFDLRQAEQKNLAEQHKAYKIALESGGLWDIVRGGPKKGAPTFEQWQQQQSGGAGTAETGTTTKPRVPVPFSSLQ
jgi:hypothetical protein